MTWRRPAERLWIAAGAASGLALAAVALTRRLNFDEPLALRAGWLALAGEEARPAFVMPWTLLLGLLGRGLADPAHALVAGRALALLALAGGGWLAARAAGRAGAGLALTLCAAQAAFVVHGLEFRYDTAILAGLLAGVGALLGAGPGAALGLGVAAAWVGLHHLKGAFFAVILLGVAGWARGRALPLGRVALGFGLALAAWGLVLGLTGLGPPWAQSWREFLALTGAAPEEESGALAKALLRDLGWWGLVLVGLGGLVRARPLVAADRALLGLGLAAALFPSLHPHPWGYMLALPAPFFALLLARRWEALPEGRPRRIALGLGAAALATQVATGGSPFEQLPRALRADRDDTALLLRRAKTLLGPEDAVLDPSGLLWFARPCVPDWYLDTLFATGLAEGRWMPELAPGVPARCTAVLQTYRLNMLPEPARQAVPTEFEAAGPLWLRPGDPRLEALRADRSFAKIKLDSYK